MRTILEAQKWIAPNERRASKKLTRRTISDLKDAVDAIKPVLQAFVSLCGRIYMELGLEA